MLPAHVLRFGLCIAVRVARNSLLPWSTVPTFATCHATTSLSSSCCCCCSWCLGLDVRFRAEPGRRLHRPTWPGTKLVHVRPGNLPPLREIQLRGWIEIVVICLCSGLQVPVGGRRCRG